MSTNTAMSKSRMNASRAAVAAFGAPATRYFQLTYMYAPAWGHGGPTRLLFDYARWMSRDAEVDVFTSDLHHDFTRLAAKSETMSGVRIHRHRLFFPSLAKKGWYLPSLSLGLGAVQCIRRSYGPVVVHFSDLRGPVPLYALLLKRLFPKRVTLVHSAFGSLHYKPGFRRKIYDAFFMKALVKSVDLRLVQNEHEGEVYRRICREHGAKEPARVVLLPLHLDGVPLDRACFTGTGKQHSAVRGMRRTYGVAEEALVFLFLGRLHIAKGIIRMIDAYLKFRESCSREATLLIVGRDDGYQRQIEDYIGRCGPDKNIRVVNNVYENRFDYYFLSDIFLGFPTIFEETMLASVEALACGTPMVVSREADIPFVAAERAGLVINFNIAEAARAMGEIADNLPAFQANARRAATHFDQARVAPKIRELFNPEGGQKVPNAA